VFEYAPIGLAITDARFVRREASVYDARKHVQHGSHPSSLDCET
jgi:hypothetical protein